MKSQLDITAIRKSLPKMPGITDEQFEKELKLTIRNITIRPTVEQAAKLVYLNLGVGIPKATVVKQCLASGLDDRMRQISEAGIQMAALAIGTKA